MLEHYIVQYGYLAVFVGCLLEGETVLVLGGFAAHRGYLALDYVILVAFVGTFLGDQVSFYLGRRWGEWLLARRPGWRPGAARAKRLLDRYGTVYILSFRFVYGVRTISSFVIGMAGIDAGRFFLLNLIAAAIWAAIVGAAGYAFGEAMTRIIAEVKAYEHIILAVVAGLSVAGWIGHVIYRRRQAKRDYRDWTMRPTDTD